MQTAVEEIEFRESQAAALAVRSQKRSRRRRRLALLAGGVLLAVLTAAGSAMVFNGWVSTDDAQVDAHMVTIAPKVGGHVVKVVVDDNQVVKAGDLLAKVDDRDFKAKVDQAQAALDQAVSKARSAGVTVPLTRDTTSSASAAASADLASAQADYLRAQTAWEQARGSDLSYAEANVAAKQADNERAQADLERMKPLVAKAEISRLQYDSYVAAARVAESEWHAAQERRASAVKQAEMAEASLETSKARIDQARAGLAQSVASQKQVAVRSADLTTSLAEVEGAKADLEAAQLQLSYTDIKAPIDGVVTRKSVEVGQLTQPGQGLLVLVPLQEVYVTANFKETQLAGVRPGQKAEVKVDAYGKTLTGHVDSISNATGSRLSLLPPENATGNFVKVVQRIPVKIVLNPDDLREYPLRVGMNVEASIETR